MFQDNKSSKPSVPSLDAGKLQDQGIETLKNKAINEVDQKLGQANAKLKNVTNKAAEYSNIVKNQPNIPMTNNVVAQDLWGNQPTSKIYNSKTIPDHDVLGINRVVNLGLVIEGKVIDF